MLLTTFDPITADFDRIIQRAFGRAADGNGAGRAVLPMDVIRRDEDVLLRIDLPGVDQDSIEVTADHGVLTVAARREEQYAEGERPVLRERLAGSFSRKIRLAETVDTEGIEASYENGVLSIRLPLQEQAKPRKIDVQRPAAPELTA